MKKLLSTSAFLLFTLYFAFSQVDLGLPFVTGMGGAANGVVKDWECIGINPANLGWKNNFKFSLSTMIVGINAQSGALDYKQLQNAILHPGDTFSNDEKKLYASIFSNAEGLNLNANLTYLALSFKVPKVGGFAMNLSDRTYGHIKLNKNAAEIMFLGMDAPIFKDTMAFLQNISKIFDDSEVGFTHYRELNVAYGAKLFGIGGTPDSSDVSFYGGVGFKYLWGMGNYEMVADNNVLTGHSAFSSKYGIQYGKIKNFTPETTSGLFSSVGNGTALDLGLGVGIGKVKITVSALDMGKITWDKNVLIASDTLLPDTSQFNFAGINSWNLAEQASQMFNDSGIIEFKPGPSYETKLLSKFRIGAGWQISRRMAIGSDLVLPMSSNPANLQNAYFAIGTEIELATNLKFAFGFAGNSTYKFCVPFGITLGRFFKICELRLATSDILTYIAPGENPTISLSFSLFRFNFDGKKKQ
ncbi:MAG: hypothetical protein EPN85_11240 [Bacteroidetes bacterium]|nr:MAG: hypothetical protein EPN85_11240 [Bacteroidota bacterium]